MNSGIFWGKIKNAKEKEDFDIQAFNLKSGLCGIKRNKRIKLNTNKAIIFS